MLYKFVEFCIQKTSAREDFRMKIGFERSHLLDLQYVLKSEYLLTNGRGGYASSTVLDCHTRKYHGLLVLPLEKYGKPFNLLSKLELSVFIDDKEFLLSTNKYPGVYHPTGHQYAERFELEHFPVTTYRIGEMRLTKSILMPRDQDMVLVKYTLTESPKPVVLKVMPLLAYRDFHGLAHENMHIRPRTFFEKNGFKIDPYDGMPPLYVQTSQASTFFPAPVWLKSLEYLKELRRGYPHREDLFGPGAFEIELAPGESVIMQAGVAKASGKMEQLWDAEVKRAKTYAAKFAKDAEPLRTLKTSVQQYLIDAGKDQQGIVAGYHWFGEWGRDTMLSLPGTTLCCKDHVAALSILQRYGRYERNGLLPNVISDHDGNHAYNSIDTCLLYFWAVQQYLAYTKDRETVEQELLPVLKSIVTAFFEKRVPLATLGDDGLLYAGNENTNLTWMDAVVFGRPATPRHGAAVEINALWYNALKFLQQFGKKISAPLAGQLARATTQFEAVFPKAFWNESQQCLFDVFRNDRDREAYIRPNQLFAVGLPFTCLDPARAAIVVETVQRHLVTPYGLRTLSPEDAPFISEYTGEQNMRDLVYHQGLVWPWLVGIFCDALLAVSADRKKAKQYFMDTFKPLWAEHLTQYGLLHISEIFRPNPPQAAKGCIAQAWSVAELVRALDTLKKIK
jgi:predicted glycogen debranching enzyme